MKQDSRDTMRSFGMLGSLGFTLVMCTFAGLAAGYFLDRILHTSPVFTIIMLLLGIAAEFIYIIYKFGQNGKN
jgi:ATP synthase protein I